MLSKVLVIGFLTVIISVIIKQYKPELSMIINICGGIIIVFLFVDQLWLILNEIIVLGDQSGIAHNILMSVIKVIIASYITEFCVDIAEDSGNKFIASKVLLGGKISICIMAFPIIKTLFLSIISLI